MPKDYVIVDQKEKVILDRYTWFCESVARYAILKRCNFDAVLWNVTHEKTPQWVKDLAS